MLAKVFALVATLSGAALADITVSRTVSHRIDPIAQPRTPPPPGSPS